MIRVHLSVGATAFLVAAVATLSLRAQGAITTGTPTSPQSSSWRQISTPDIMIIGNASERELRRNFSKIMAFRDAVATLFPSMKLSSGIPMRIVICGSADAFSRYQPRDEKGKRWNTAGFTSFNPDANFIVFPVGDDSYPVVFHEYAHYLVHLNTIAALPTWLDEGLAEFYSTFEAEYD